MKKRVAIFRSQYGNMFAFEVRDFENDPDYTRISEIMEVEFEMLSEGELINSQVISIDKMIDKVTSESLRKIEELKMQRAELLALTHEAKS